MELERSGILNAYIDTILNGASIYTSNPDNFKVLNNPLLIEKVLFKLKPE